MHEFLIKSFITLFVIIDPFGILPVYISLTGSYTRKHRMRTVLKSSLISAGLLIFFALFGGRLLYYLGIYPGSFYVAGGILLFVLSLNMIFGYGVKNKKTSEEEEEEEEIAVFPLAIPMICGPGTIASVIMLVSNAGDDMMKTAIVIACAVFIVFVTALVMLSSELMIKLLGKTGISTIDRIMGIILSALSVQFIFRGISELARLM